jgi:DNA primase
MNGRDHEGTVDRDLLLAANEDAARFYRNQVLAPSNRGPRDYLTARGFGALLEETPWTIGYAPAGWTTLVGHLRKQGYPDDTLLAAGLACRTRRNTLIDRFRDRITFGIRNQEAELVGFTARCGPSAPAMVPKYLNTPTTAIYRKGEAPFGLAEQQGRIAAGAVPTLVEGPFDAIAIQLVGLEPAEDFAGIALCGTAMSPTLATRLAQLNDRRVVLAFDSDDAGTLATERAACALAPKYADVRAVSRHSVGDPAEVLSRSGGPTLLAQLRGACPASDKVIDAHLEKWAGRLDQVDAKIGCLREAAGILALLAPADPARHAVQLSELLGVSVGVVTSELVEAMSQPASKVASSRDQSPSRRAHGSAQSRSLNR